jgi:hypothetical protein
MTSGTVLEPGTPQIGICQERTQPKARLLRCRSRWAATRMRFAWTAERDERRLARSLFDDFFRERSKQAGRNDVRRTQACVNISRQRYLEFHRHDAGILALARIEFPRPIAGEMRQTNNSNNVLIQAPRSLGADAVAALQKERRNNCCNQAWLLKNSFSLNWRKQNCSRMRYKRSFRISRHFVSPKFWLF